MSKNPKSSTGERIVAAGFGIIWTIITISIMGGNEMIPAVVRILFPGFGILLTIAALAGFSGEHSSSGDENAAPKSEISLQRQERPAAPREKKTVFCPYCGTAQEEDYKTCDSCGAARKNK